MENSPQALGSEGSIDAGRNRQQREGVARDIMKTKLFLVCCAALALGSGCATYDSGGTADDTVVVTGSGYRDYYEPYPYRYDYVGPRNGYYRSPVPTVWKQGSPNGQDWVDARPEFNFWAR